MFDKLDTDKDGTLNARELQGRLSRKGFIGADRDNDLTLTKDGVAKAAALTLPSPSASADLNPPVALWPGFWVNNLPPVDLLR